MADGIAAWLDGLGLGRYAQAFIDNEIDLDVLPDLTEEGLRELGLPRGPRKKLLRSIGGPPVVHGQSNCKGRAVRA